MEQVDAVVAELRRIGDAHGDGRPARSRCGWIIAKGAVPIPGAKNRAQAEQNAGALGLVADVGRGRRARPGRRSRAVRSLQNRFWQHG